MRNSLMFWIFLAAILLGPWPVIAKFSNLGSGQMIAIVSFATMLITVPGILVSKLPAQGPFAICFAAGIMQGLGLLALGKVIAWPNVELSKVLPTIDALLPIFAALAAIIAFHEPVTARKFMGLSTMVAGISVGMYLYFS